MNSTSSNCNWISDLIRAGTLFLVSCTLHAAEPFFPEGVRFRADSQIQESKYGEGANAWSLFSEEGEVGAVRYSFDHYYGKGVIGQWTVECGVDEIDRFRWCALDRSALRIYRNSRGEFVLLVGHNQYPRSLVHLRLNRGKIFRTTEPGWTGSTARQIATAMSKEESVSSRYWAWPYRSDVDENHGISGLGLGLKYLEFAVRNTSKPARTRLLQP